MPHIYGDDIREHPWFKDINWRDIAQKKHKAKVKPKIKGDGDVRNIDEQFT